MRSGDTSSSQEPIIPEADLRHVDEELVETLLPFQRQGVK